MNLDAIPAELRTYPQWIVWRREQRDGKPTKVPYRALDPARKASATDPATWTSFDEAAHALASVPDLGGLGFVFSTSDPFAGIDLDEITSAEGDHPAAVEVIAELASYTERSPSRSGVHVIVGAALAGAGRKTGSTPWGGSFEVYDAARFFTVTGDRLLSAPTTIEERQGQLDRLCRELFPAAAEPPPRPRVPVAASDAELIDRAHRARNGAAFAALWRGDTSSYGADESAADLALCAHLAFWTGGDGDRVDALFRGSGLMRGKWDERRGSTTYGRRTIAVAIVGTTTREDGNMPTTNGHGLVAATVSRNGHGRESGDAPPADWLVGSPMDPAAVSPTPPPLLPGFPYMHAGMAAVISGPTGGGRSSLVQAGAYDAALAGLRVAYLGGEVTESEFNDRAALLADARGDEVTDWLRGELARARWLDLGDVMTAAWKRPDEWIAKASAAYDVVIIDPLSDVMAALDLEDKAADYVRFYKRLIEPLRDAGPAVVILDNIGHAEDAQHRPSGTSSKMNKADLLFSCVAIEEPSALRMTCTKRRATRAQVQKGDAWLFTESTQEVEPQGRLALVTLRRRSPREDQRSARLGAILRALGDEPLSVRKVVEKAGEVRGRTIPVGTAQELLINLKVAREADQMDAGWVRCSGVQVLKEPEHLNTPSERLFEEHGEEE